MTGKGGVNPWLAEYRMADSNWRGVSYEEIHGLSAHLLILSRRFWGRFQPRTHTWSFRLNITVWTRPSLIVWNYSPNISDNIAALSGVTLTTTRPCFWVLNRSRDDALKTNTSVKIKSAPNNRIQQTTEVSDWFLWVLLYCTSVFTDLSKL